MAIDVAEAEVDGYLPLQGDGEFGISFIHSVDKLPVEDWYVVREGEIVQDSTRLLEFGAGMGHIPGQGTGRPDGSWWEVYDIDRHIGELVVRAGRPQTQHRLLHPDATLDMSACWSGDRVSIRAARVSTAVRFLQAPMGTGGCS